MKINVAILRRKWSLVRRRTGGHIFKRLCAPGPRTMLTSAKTRILCEKHAFFENRHEKIDKMQENENRVQTETRRFCLVSVREKHFRYVFGKTPDGAPLPMHRNEDEIPRTPYMRWKSLIFPERFPPQHCMGSGGSTWSRQQRAVNRRLRHVRSLQHCLGSGGASSEAAEAQHSFLC